MGDFHVRPRLVLISNGKQTDLTDIDSEILPEVETHEVLYSIHIRVLAFCFGLFWFFFGGGGECGFKFAVLKKSLNVMHK